MDLKRQTKESENFQHELLKLKKCENLHFSIAPISKDLVITWFFMVHQWMKLTF